MISELWKKLSTAAYLMWLIIFSIWGPMFNLRRSLTRVFRRIMQDFNLVDNVNPSLGRFDKDGNFFLKRKTEEYTLEELQAINRLLREVPPANPIKHAEFEPEWTMKQWRQMIDCAVRINDRFIDQFLKEIGKIYPDLYLSWADNHVWINHTRSSIDLRTVKEVSKAMQRLAPRNTSDEIIEMLAKLVSKQLSEVYPPKPTIIIDGERVRLENEE